MSATALDEVAHGLQAFREGLVAHGLVLPTSVRGVWGRGTAMEDIIQRFDALVLRETAGDGAQPLAFPPVLPRTLIEQLGYLDNFPQLAGSVHSFMGNDAQGRELARLADSGGDWEALLAPTDVMLTPAACYPVYPSFSGLLPQGGRLITVLGWVFRHEPSDEPTRLQSFRMREFIRMGSPDTVVAWRDGWLQRGLDLLRRLGLPARSDVAADPFFGRSGRMMAAQQVEQRLKFEILVPVISEAQPTAVCSFNWHQDHFSGKFGIRGAGGATAHTACLGFGLERVALALIRTHGFEPAAWPDDVRALLWP
ncbi:MULTISPECIES: amino acid--[acyl-carrier-protein] ligase [Ramlibacter]|uniref:Amino acid--[acyl-carrier-protein] ligase n=1 Tax=Ramlibacter aquaticus TaxID=2780094 RepID=A0ABR9SHX7_9BURK|nr:MULTISPECIES: amino acid--[acyl-carrier-protein] ligase [Ramlibacter]MBE7941342.1 amino acid--[acyl-carrier-protein] ligase [Ramlibacter aquaticus]